MQVTDTRIQLDIQGLTQYLPLGLGYISLAYSSITSIVSSIVQDRQILKNWIKKWRGAIKI